MAMGGGSTAAAAAAARGLVWSGARCCDPSGDDRVGCVSEDTKPQHREQSVRAVDAALIFTLGVSYGDQSSQRERARGARVQFKKATSFDLLLVTAHPLASQSPSAK